MKRSKVHWFALAVGCFGLLLWARLILVTGHPRSVNATPTTPTAAAMKSKAAAHSMYQDQPPPAPQTPHAAHNSASEPRP